MKSTPIILLTTLMLAAAASLKAFAYPKPDSQTDSVQDDPAWYDRGITAITEWMHEDFPVIYCDTAYSDYRYNIVVRAILSRDRRMRVRMSVSGDSVPPACGTMIRFVTPTGLQ